MLVRGAQAVVDDEGAEHAVTRPVVAVCTCGRSSLKPWCDGTHQVVKPRVSDTDG
jgi:CDGSH-type Zn-finger protein